MSHLLKTNPRLLLKSFKINFRNDGKYNSHPTYKQDVGHGSPAGDARYTKARMTVKTQLWLCNFKTLQSKMSQMPKMAQHPKRSHWQMSQKSILLPGPIIWSKPLVLNYIYWAISSWIRAREQNNQHITHLTLTIGLYCSSYADFYELTFVEES